MKLNINGIYTNYNLIINIYIHVRAHIYTCMCKNCANAFDLFKSNIFDNKEKFQSTQGIGFQISAKVAALNFHFVDVIV